MNKGWDLESDTPSKAGIYAILYCWDAEEGIFDGAGYWNGKNWDSDAPMYSFSKETFSDASSAADWADSNNPDNNYEVTL